MKKYILPILFAGLTLQFTGCSDFLNTTPDNRTQIDSRKKVRQLLVTAYSQGSYSLLGELSSDNMIDNNSPDDKGEAMVVSSYNRMDDEIYAWNDVVSSSAQDSPFFIWDACYHAIATANAALEACEELEKQGQDMSGEKGEALICRAYHHFILVNVFSQPYKDDNLSMQDLGIPYSDKPETVVAGKYDRETVTDTYARIEKDIEAGLPLVTDEYYTVPKYHFNRKAAYAFASRFYLYKRDWNKVVEYSNRVLSEASKSTLRDCESIKKSGYPSSEIYLWIDANAPTNLLLMPSYSTFMRRLANLRYAFNREAQKGSIRTTGGPSWSNAFPGYPMWGYDHKYGGFLSKTYEIFEYTDKIAGIGYPRIVRIEFTLNETLLCRAEALIHLGRLSEALQDLDLWSKASLCEEPISDASIRNFYTSDRPLVTPELNAELISPSFTIPENIIPYIHCILHFRRIETLHDGLRWFDLKRYGIDVTHKIGPKTVETLKCNDERRAIQIPQEVISAGIVPNPRSSADINNPSFGHAGSTVVKPINPSMEYVKDITDEDESNSES